MAGLSYKTAISRRALSAPARWLRESQRIIGRTLDYGCGRGGDADRLKCDRYDPHWHNVRLEGLYDTILCTFVANVLDADERTALLRALQDRLSLMGVAFIAVRRDVKQDGLTGAGTYQENVVLDLPLEYERKGAFAIYSLTRDLDMVG